MPVYAVARGRCVGIYNTLTECKAQVAGFIGFGGMYKRFNTPTKAKNFIEAIKSVDKKAALYKESEIYLRSKLQFSKIENPIIEIDQKNGSNKRTFPEAFKIKDKPLKKARFTKRYGDHKFQEDEDGFVHVYTDGSCFDNGKRDAAAGFGIYFGEGHKLNTAAPVAGRATNNCAEIQAATLSVKLAHQMGISKLVIHTDSHFLIKANCYWIHKWKRNNWKLSNGCQVINKHHFLQLDEAITKSDITIRWNYVRAHRGTLGNERADKLAKEGAIMYRIIQSSKDFKP